MEHLLITVILTFGFSVTWWNCVIIGKIWIETMIAGGWARAIIWCAALHSAIVFSILMLFTGAVCLYDVGFTLDDIKETIMTSAYLVILLPITGAVLALVAVELLPKSDNYQTYIKSLAPVAANDNEDPILDIATKIVFLIMAITGGAGILLTAWIIQRQKEEIISLLLTTHRMKQ